MVEEECRRYRPTKNYLEHLPPLNTTAFETDMMRSEFDRIAHRLPMEPLSMKRYELPPPPPGKMAEHSAWLECVDNSKAQLEHQAVRALNLELMTEYGCESWKAYLEILTALLAQAQTQLADLKKEIQEVNWLRKSKQTDAGEKLKSLEAQWVSLVSKNYEIEQACVKLEEEIFEVKQRVVPNNVSHKSNDIKPVENNHTDDVEMEEPSNDAENTSEMETPSENDVVSEEVDAEPAVEEVIETDARTSKPDDMDKEQG